MTLQNPERWAEIERVLDVALELAPEERDRSLGSMCATDPELRMEVERLLAACQAADHFLEDPAPVAAAAVVASVAREETLEPGDRLGPYEIVRELGRGGMAVVYLARDHKHHRSVALKVLLPEIAVALGHQRFLREIQIAANLAHPHILPLHDSGQAGGMLYYVMPYVEGESLRARLTREGPLALDDALGIAQQVLAALGYAHAHGVLHRDIKPENILLHGDQAVVADFGIARAVSEAGEDTLTQPGLIMGTPAYMSPEQTRADAQLDGRSDLYSLGCVLYEMLAGEPPFTGPSAQAIIARHAIDPVPSLRTVRPGVPQAVDHTIERLLAKVPADRFASAQELAAALTQAASGESPGPAPARSDHRRRRRLVLLGTTGLLVAVSAAVVARIGDDAAKNPTDGSTMLAVLPFKNLGAPADQYFADGLTEEITSRLAVVGDLGVISRSSTDRYRGTSKSLKQVGRELGVGYVLEGSIRWDRRPDGTSRIRVTPQLVRVADDRHVWANRYDADLRDVFEIQTNIAEHVTTALGLVIARADSGGPAEKPTTNISAYDAYLRGNATFPNDFYGSKGQIMTRLQRAAENYREAVRFDSTFALAYAKLGSTAVNLYSQGNYDSSAAAEAKAAIDRALRLDPDLGEAHYALGVYRLLVDPDTTEAMRELETAVRRSPNNADLLMDLANTEWNLRGPKSQAITRAERAVQLDPRNQRRMVVLAFLYQEAQRFEEAERTYDRAIALRPENPGPYTQKAVNYLIGYGDIARARQVLRQAARQVDTMELIGAAATTLMPQHFLGVLDQGYQRAVLGLPVSAFGGDTAWYGLAKGTVYRALGDSVRFRAYCDTGLAVARARHDDFMMSFLLGGLGYRKEAYAAFARARAASAPHLMLDEWEARLAILAGDYERAIEILERKNWGRHLTVPWLRADPFWDPIRRDPRFQRLVRRDPTEARR
jgi:serine/threonine-protein kinase